MSIALTDGFVKRMKAIREQEGKPELMLRVLVEGGGCQGFEYKFEMVTDMADDDDVFEEGGVKVVIDPVSMELLMGSEIDYVDDLVGSYFKINNPNATSSCGCGTSFST